MKDFSIEIYKALKNIFGEGKCELNFYDDYSLMVAVILSAQCTDKRVNLITPKLFEKYPDYKSLANANISQVEEIIKPCGFYKVKSNNIINACKCIIKDYNGILPNSMEKLITLPGVGRKTANVLLSNIYNIPSIAVDTHVFRVSNRLGLANADNVFDCEMQLRQNIEEKYWSEMHHLLVLFGRYICKARNPLCDECVFKDKCKEYKQKWSGKNL